MEKEMIQFKGNGGSYPGYLTTERNGPGVVVIQEWWGLVDHMRDICDRFAREGFVALAPDLYNGRKATSPDEAGKLFMALNISEAGKILKGAIDELLARPECTSKTVGTVGFCMGGQLSMYAAATNPEQVSACVNFYGIHPNVNPPFQDMKSPLQGHFAENDKSVNAKTIAALHSKLESLGKQHEFHVYPGTGHAFFNDTRKEVHKRDAADLAWKRTVAFLRHNVK